MTNKQEILLFQKWSFNGIEAKDKGISEETVAAIVTNIESLTKIMQIPGFNFANTDPSSILLVELFAWVIDKEPQDLRGIVFGNKISTSLEGELKEDSGLVTIIRRLQRYKELLDNPPTTNLELFAEPVPTTFSAGSVKNEGNNGKEFVQYLSGVDATEYDTRILFDTIKGARVALDKTLVTNLSQGNSSFVSIPVENLLDLDTITVTEDGKVELSHNPGLQAFIELVRSYGMQNILVGLQVDKESKTTLGNTTYATKDLIEKILEAGGVNNAIVHDSIKTISDAIVLREHIETTHNIPTNNMSIATNSKFKVQKNMRFIIMKEGLKIFNAGTDCSLHALLLFGLFYSQLENPVIDGKLSNELLKVLLQLGMDEKEIKNIREKGLLYFKVTFKRISETLNEFHKSRILIDIAA